VLKARCGDVACAGKPAEDETGDDQQKECGGDACEEELPCPLFLTAGGLPLLLAQAPERTSCAAG
jgi:hypothetical protein